jgi:hypothetical protein
MGCPQELRADSLTETVRALPSGVLMAQLHDLLNDRENKYGKLTPSAYPTASADGVLAKYDHEALPLPQEI